MRQFSIRCLALVVFVGGGFSCIDEPQPSANDPDDSITTLQGPSIPLEPLANSTNTTCGNGTVEGEEVCDDGGQEDGDYCARDCDLVLGRCGDGVIQLVEVCDDGNTADGDSCAANCQTQTSLCGDGVVAGKEKCDDGNTRDGDYCAGDCSAVSGNCGDNLRQFEDWP